MARSGFGPSGAWDESGVGVLHAAGAALAVIIIVLAVLNRVGVGALRPVLGVVSVGLVPVVVLCAAWWAYRRYSSPFLPLTPAGPDETSRVQCSASDRASAGLGTITDSMFEPELFGVWLSDSPRAAGKAATLVAALGGSAAMAVMNTATFNNPFHAAFITLGLAGPAAGVALLSIAYPVEWKVSPGQLEILRPGLLGISGRTRTDQINLRTSRLFVDADAHRAWIKDRGRILRLRYDLTSRRREITRMLLMAAVSTSETPIQRAEMDSSG